METNCSEELKCLYQDIKILLTGGRFELEINYEDWCSLLRLTIDDFYAYLHMWIINNKFSSFFGKNVTSNDVCLSLTTASFDYELTLAQAYSEDIGLSSRGGRFELQKGFVDIVEGNQVYQIPAGREVKKVLFMTPSQIDAAIFSSWGYGNMGLSGSGLAPYGSFGFGGAGVGGVFPLFPAHDVILRAAHLSITDRMLNSDLTYRITKGPNGTRLLHLFSLPENNRTRSFNRDMYRCKVWYEYYDTNILNDSDAAECRKDCEKIYSPTQIDLPKQDYCDLNHFSKTWIRKWLTAYTKQVLGRARGKFKGKLVNMGGDSLELDWDILLAEAKEEFSELKTELQDFLTDLRSDKQLERKAGEAENLNKILSYSPMPFKVI